MCKKDVLYAVYMCISGNPYFSLYFLNCILQEEAMDAFVQPETLEGANQYFCEKCNKKCNAHKVMRQHHGKS